MKFPRLDSDKAYVAASLYLPRTRIAEGPVRGALTFGLDRSNEPRVLVIEHPNHIEVPRAFLTRAQIEEEMGIPVVDLRPKEFPGSSLRPRPGFQLRERQVPAWEVFSKAENGILHLACGAGKTIMGLYKAAHAGKATLIVSPQGAHLDNWESELNNYFLLDGKIGRIGDGKMDYEHEVVLATVQTLAGRAEAGELPEDFATRFGTVIFDEVHHMSASFYVKSADVCMGNRFGLTATPKRIDRSEGIFLSHIGPILFSDDAQEMIPEVEVLELDTTIDDKAEREVTDRSGERHIGLLRAWLGRNEERNAAIRVRLDEAIAAGRTVFALSHVVEHVRWWSQQYPGSGLITGETPSKERLKQLNSSKLVFATFGVATEAYNRKDLDSLFVLTPLAADGYAEAPQLRQAIGRVQRAAPGKRTPEVILFLDRNIPEAAGLTFSVLGFLKQQKFPFRSTTWTANRRRNPLART